MPLLLSAASYPEVMHCGKDLDLLVSVGVFRIRATELSQPTSVTGRPTEELHLHGDEQLMRFSCSKLPLVCALMG